MNTGNDERGKGYLSLEGQERKSKEVRKGWLKSIELGYGDDKIIIGLARKSDVFAKLLGTVLNERTRRGAETESFDTYFNNFLDEHGLVQVPKELALRCSEYSVDENGCYYVRRKDASNYSPQAQDSQEESSEGS